MTRLKSPSRRRYKAAFRPEADLFHVSGEDVEADTEDVLTAALSEVNCSLA